MIICKDMCSLCDISKFCSAHSWCGGRTCCACVHGYCVWRLHIERGVTELQFNFLPKEMSLIRCWHMVVPWHSHLSLCWYPGNSLYSFVKCFQSGFKNHFVSHKKIMESSLLMTLDLGHMYVSCFWPAVFTVSLDTPRLALNSAPPSADSVPFCSQTSGQYCPRVITPWTTRCEWSPLSSDLCLKEWSEPVTFSIFFIFFVLCFETGFFCVTTLAVLELTL